MARGDDSILLGELQEDRDSDGDGVGDLQERLDGTDPADGSDRARPAPTRDLANDDPRGAPEREGLERETVFDRDAGMPDGTSLDTALAGLTDLGGDALRTGPNRHGVGEDALLDGKVGANSPLGMDRDPLASDAPSSGPPPPSGGVGTADSGSGQTGSSSIGGGFGTAPPDGADLSFRAPNVELVSGVRDTVNSWFTGDKSTPDAGTPKVVRPEGDTPVPRTPVEPKVPDAGTPKPPKEPMVYTTNPDADPGDAGGVVSDGDLTRIVNTSRGDTDFVEGHGGGFQTDEDAPPVRYGDLVTDPGEDSGDTAAVSGPSDGRPDAPVVHTINPDVGVLPPPTSGGPPPDPGGGTYQHETSLEAPDLVASGLAPDLGGDLRPELDDAALAGVDEPPAHDPAGSLLPGDDGLDV